jgi:hypothetical protein
MAYIGFVIDRQYSAAACGRSTAELHVTLAHIPTGAKPSLQDEIPGQVLLELDTLFSYIPPQSMTLSTMERFGSVLVRRAHGADEELMKARARVREVLESHKIQYSKDYEPWTPHCSIGIDYPAWCWVDAGERPSYVPQPVAVHSSRAVLAGLRGVVAHHWNLGDALRARVSPTTIVGD